MAATWPLVVARLVTLLPTLPSWAPPTVKVFDGAAYDIPSTVAAYATVAHASDGVQTRAGSYTKTLAPDGFRYLENGVVHNQLTVTADGPSITAIRSQIVAMFDELEGAVRADRKLGVLSAEGYVDLTVDVSSIQAVPGASTTLDFALTYFTVT